MGNGTSAGPLMGNGQQGQGGEGRGVHEVLSFVALSLHNNIAKPQRKAMKMDITLAEAQELYRLFDTNRDEYVTPEELLAAIKDISDDDDPTQWSLSEAHELLNMFGGNRKGLSKGAFLKWWSSSSNDPGTQSQKELLQQLQRRQPWQLCVVSDRGDLVNFLARGGIDPSAWRKDKNKILSLLLTHMATGSCRLRYRVNPDYSDDQDATIPAIQIRKEVDEVAIRVYRNEWRNTTKKKHPFESKLVLHEVYRTNSETGDTARNGGFISHTVHSSEGIIPATTRCLKSAFGTVGGVVVHVESGVLDIVEKESVDELTGLPVLTRVYDAKAYVAHLPPYPFKTCEHNSPITHYWDYIDTARLLQHRLLPNIYEPRSGKTTPQSTNDRGSDPAGSQKEDDIDERIAGEPLPNTGASTGSLPAYPLEEWYGEPSEFADDDRMQIESYCTGWRNVSVTPVVYLPDGLFAVVVSGVDGLTLQSCGPILALLDRTEKIEEYSTMWTDVNAKLGRSLLRFDMPLVNEIESDRALAVVELSIPHWAPPAPHQVMPVTTIAEILTHQMQTLQEKGEPDCPSGNVNGLRSSIDVLMHDLFSEYLLPLKRATTRTVCCNLVTGPRRDAIDQTEDVGGFPLLDSINKCVLGLNEKPESTEEDPYVDEDPVETAAVERAVDRVGALDGEMMLIDYYNDFIQILKRASHITRMHVATCLVNHSLMDLRTVFVDGYQAVHLVNWKHTSRGNSIADITAIEVALMFKHIPYPSEEEEPDLWMATAKLLRVLACCGDNVACVDKTGLSPAISYMTSRILHLRTFVKSLIMSKSPKEKEWPISLHLQWCIGILYSILELMKDEDLTDEQAKMAMTAALIYSDRIKSLLEEGRGRMVESEGDTKVLGLQSPRVGIVPPILMTADGDVLEVASAARGTSHANHVRDVLKEYGRLSSPLVGEASAKDSQASATTPRVDTVEQHVPVRLLPAPLKKKIGGHFREVQDGHDIEELMNTSTLCIDATEVFLSDKWLKSYDEMQSSRGQKRGIPKQRLSSQSPKRMHGKSPRRGGKRSMMNSAANAAAAVSASTQAVNMEDSSAVVLESPRVNPDLDSSISRCALLLGPHGSGKTLCLKRMAALAAMAQSPDRADAKRVPFYIDCRDFLAAADPKKVDWESTDLIDVYMRWRYNARSETYALFKSTFKSGRLFLLMDGADMLPVGYRIILFAYLKHSFHTHSKSCFGRSLGSMNCELEGSPHQIVLATRLIDCYQLYEIFHDWNWALMIPLSARDRVSVAKASHGVSIEQAEEIINRAHTVPLVSKMTDSPLMLQYIAKLPELVELAFDKGVVEPDLQENDEIAGEEPNDAEDVDPDDNKDPYEENDGNEEGLREDYTPIPEEGEEGEDNADGVADNSPTLEQPDEQDEDAPVPEVEDEEIAIPAEETPTELSATSIPNVVLYYEKLVMALLRPGLNTPINPELDESLLLDLLGLIAYDRHCISDAADFTKEMVDRIDKEWRKDMGRLGHELFSVKQVFSSTAMGIGSGSKHVVGDDEQQEGEEPQEVNEPIPENIENASQNEEGAAAGEVKAMPSYANGFPHESKNVWPLLYEELLAHGGLPLLPQIRKKTYRFVHRTLQSFLAARYVVNRFNACIQEPELFANEFYGVFTRQARLDVLVERKFDDMVFFIIKFSAPDLLVKILNLLFTSLDQCRNDFEESMILKATSRIVEFRGIGGLRDVMNYPGLTTLEVGHWCGILERDTAASRQILKQFKTANSGITNVFLRNAIIGGSAADWIATLLAGDKVNSMETLTIQATNFGSRKTAGIAQAISWSTSLKTVNLAFNKMSDESFMRLLLAHVVKSKSIESLHLTCNGIGDGCGDALADLLKRSKTLKSLTLKSEGIGNNTVMKLANGLLDNTTLTSLDLSGSNNDISNPGLVSLFGAVEVNPSVKYLDVQGAHCSNYAGKSLAGLVRHNVVLETLLLGNTQITSQVGSTIKDALAENKTLQNLVVKFPEGH